MDWLKARVNAAPDALALIIGQEKWTYADLDRLVDLVCLGLQDKVQPGQIVAVLLPNNLAYVCLIHASARLGVVLLPLNTRLTTQELAWQLEYTDCDLLVYGRDTAVTSQELSMANAQLSVVNSENLFVENEGDPSPKHHPKFALGNLQAIVFTSGTTGKPKGAMLTFANHFWSALASAYRLGLHNDDLWLSCLPLYHVGGLAVIWRSCLYGTAVCLHPRFDVEAVSHDLDNHPITLISLVPTMIYRLLAWRGERPFSPTLRHLLLGGAAATPELVEHCHALGIPVATTYGLTEAASQVATMLPQDVVQKPGSVGKALMFSQVRIVNERGDAMLPGELGEVVVSGPTVMAGYYQDAQATAVTLQNGELHTGDIGYLDIDGDLWLVQRRSDIIISGGENVYPAEVEAVLRGHTAVAAVCVVGIEHPEWGQQVAALVVLSDGKIETGYNLQNYCRQHLAGYKVPRLLHIVTELPQTASGKVARNEVQTLLRQEL